MLTSGELHLHRPNCSPIRIDCVEHLGVLGLLEGRVGSRGGEHSSNSGITADADPSFMGGEFRRDVDVPRDIVIPLRPAEFGYLFVFGILFPQTVHSNASQSAHSRAGSESLFSYGASA